MSDHLLHRPVKTFGFDPTYNAVKQQGHAYVVVWSGSQRGSMHSTEEGAREEATRMERITKGRGGPVTVERINV